MIAFLRFVMWTVVVICPAAAVWAVLGGLGARDGALWLGVTAAVVLTVEGLNSWRERRSRL